MRTLSRRTAVLGILLMAVAVVAPLAAAASAQTDQSGQTGGLVTVIQVNGYLDPIEADFINRAVGQAERDHVDALVIQLDSAGAIVSDATLDKLVERIHEATVDVGVWVGPSGARVAGGYSAEPPVARHMRSVLRSMDSSVPLALPYSCW